MPGTASVGLLLGASIEAAPACDGVTLCTSPGAASVGLVWGCLGGGEEPGGVVVRGLRCDERELAKLFPAEAALLTRATSRDDDDASVPEIVHGRCGEGITHERLPVYV